MSVRERVRSWLGRAASLLVVVAFGLGWTLLADESGKVLLAVLLPFVGASLLVDIGQRLGEGDLKRTDLVWGLAGAALIVAGVYFVAQVGWLWLVAGAALVVVEVLVMRFLPEPDESPDSSGDALRDEEHVIAEHVIDERARRGVPPM